MRVRGRGFVAAPGGEGVEVISVVIVTFFTPAEMLQSCVSSIRLSAEAADCESEVVCVENGRTDWSTNPELGLDVCVATGMNVGFGRAANLGIGLAQGEIVLLLNPDATLLVGALRELLNALESYHGHALVGAWILSHDSVLQVDAYFSWSSSLSRLARRARYRNYLLAHASDRVVSVEKVSGGALFATRACLRELGPFDETFFLYGEDDDLSRRASRSGLAVVACPAALVRHLGSYASSGHAALVERARVDATLRLLRLHHGPMATWAGILELSLVTFVGLLVPSRTSSASPVARRARFAEIRRWVRHRGDAPPLVPSLGRS